MVGDIMSKKNNSKKQQKQENTISTPKIKDVIIIIVVGTIILLVFYLLTKGILNKKNKDTTRNNASIQYSEILCGESFSQKEKEYLVFFYDSTGSDIDTNHSIISNYKEKKKIKIYTVDMNEGLNKSCKSEIEENENAISADELMISKTTLIHFKNGKVVNYITEEIEQYLNNL